MKWLASVAVVMTGLGLTGAGVSAPNACTFRQVCVFDSYPQWSPDGQRIAFLRSSSVEEAIYTVAVPGGEAQRVVDVRSYPGPAPILSPDWTKVAFWDGGPLKVKNLDGSDPHLIAASGFSFSWAPDSQRLAYTGAAEIFVVDADGTGATSLGPGGSPTWSPDGRQLAFIDPSGSLSVMNRDGTSRRVVYSGEVAAGGPSWSPDGTRLAFLIGDSLTVMNLDGTQLRTLQRGFVGIPQWSHDGSQIAADLALQRVPNFAVVDTATGVERSFKGGDSSWSPVTNDLAATYDGPCVFTGVRLIAIKKRASRRLTLDCHLRGTPRNDRIVGTNLKDVIAGLAGNDTLAGEGDVDIIGGGSGEDRLLGGSFGDFLNGGPGDDLLIGGVDTQDAYAVHDDVLSGGPGADELRGGVGQPERGFRKRRAAGRSRLGQPPRGTRQRPALCLGRP
jgi:Tol biopolymer transport system component